MDKGSKIAVTGGSGFLGSHIIRGLLEQGYHNIHALRRKASRMFLAEDFVDKITWHEGDVLDVISLEDLVVDASVVIHSAAMVTYNPKYAKEVQQVNVEGTANIVNASLKQKPDHFIFLSSVAAIGRHKSGETIDENSEWHDSQYNTHYAKSKYLAELEVWRGMNEGLTVGILNPSMIIGPGEWGKSSTKVVMHVLEGKRLMPAGANGFVDVRDVAIATIRMMEKKVTNERFVIVGENKSYQELFSKIAKQADLKPPSTIITPLMGKIGWRVEALKAFFSKKDPSITEETVRITAGDFIYDNSRSKEILGVEYKPLNQTIRDTLESYQQSASEKKSYGYFKQIYQ